MNRAPRRKPGIDRETLIAAALRIIDAEGADGITMRRLGTELGVSQMAAYRHFDGKDALLRETAAWVVAGMSVEPDEHWQDLVRKFFEDFHDRLVRPPGVAELFGGQTFLSETVYAVSEPVFAALLNAGFDAETAVSLFMGCATCSIGAAVLEAEEAEQLRTGRSDVFVLVSRENFPAIAAVASHLPTRQTPKAHSTALRHLIAGYASSLDQK